MKQVLVTGAGGNVGQYLVQRLFQKGYEVTGIYRNIKPQNARYRLVKADLSEELPQLPDVDTVIHVAAGLGGTAEDLIRNNLKSMENLIHFAKKAHVKQFIYTSTVSVYGNVKGELCENSDMVNPENYGVTKFLAEQMLHESSIQEKITLQLPRMLGPYVNLKDTRNSGFLTMVRKILADEDVCCFIPKQKYNNYLHVDDLAGFIIQLMETEIHLKDEKVVLGVRECLEMMEILQIMKEEAGSKSRIIAEDCGESAKCSFINIEKAMSFGFLPCGAETTLRRFIREVL